MKQQVLIDGWWIRQATEAEKTADHASFSQVPCADKDGWVFTKNAEQVQKVLLENSLLDERVAVGETERCAWIEQEDWIYRCDFHCDNDFLGQGKRIYLNFKGVDLFADFYLNGEWIGSHDNMLIPKRIEVTGKLQKENHLMVYFYSTRKRMDALFAAMPEEFQRNSKPHCMLRKGQIEFGDAGKVSMINVGLYADVLLEVIDLAEITWPDIETTLDFWHRFADIHYTLHGSGTLGTAYFTTALYSPSGILLHEEQIPLPSETPEWQASSSIRVPSPELWWPIHYGKQPLYRLVFSLYADGRLLDTAERQIGIREVKKTGDMRFRINGKEIKQWGALLEPFNGLTHRWDSRKCREMLDLTEHANINTLRIWGGSMQFEDELYNECDRRGILLWHEFCLSWHPTPDTEEYSRQYRREAEYEVRRVKHHPCVLLYSGGNESLVGLIEGLPDHPAFGWKAFMKDFKEVCQKLDPNRFYLDSSPCGGDYPSDPREGDSHPLYYTYRHAVTQYPLFVSEQARSTTGPLRSLRRFMSEEELWPKGYVNQVTASQFNPTYNTTYPEKPYYQYDPDYQKKYNVGWSVPQLNDETPFMVTSWKKVPVPTTWWRRAASFFSSECSPLERFFDAENIDELIYRINAATAWFFKDDLERIRRGKPHYAVGEPRRCQGYIYVKLNDTWPQFYCTLIDYFQEVYIPYYQFRRSLSPILLSFDFQDRIYLWGVNDTLQETIGRLEVKVFSQIRNRIVNEFTIPASIEAGESKVLTTLDRVCPITTESVVQAKLIAEDGTVIASSDTLVDLERHQSFPRAALSLRMEEDTLIVTTDRYAHCVEITGNEDGDENHWYFEDNYFNLFPYEEKRIRIFGHHRKGTISAKAHFSDLITQITL